MWFLALNRNMHHPVKCVEVIVFAPVSIGSPQFDDFTKMRSGAKILRRTDKKMRWTAQKMRSSDKCRFRKGRKTVIFNAIFLSNTIIL